MKRSPFASVGKLMLLAYVLFLIATFIKKNESVNDPLPLRAQLDSPGEPFSAAPESRFIKLASGEHINEALIARRLNALLPEKGKAWYSYSWIVNDEIVSDIAPGLDYRYHFANAFLDGFVPFKNVPLWMPIYSLSHTKRYRRDDDQYGPLAMDIWQTSRQSFFYDTGDCEDHAIALTDWLIGLGADARVVLGTVKGEGHAWVVLLRDGQSYLLEATHKNLHAGLAFPLTRFLPEYQPEFMFNRDDFWVNTGSKQTTDYRGERWVRRSQFGGH